MKLYMQPWLHYSAAQNAAAALENAGFEAYIIGGAVRDMLLGFVPKDFDLVTNAPPRQVLKIKNFRKSHYKDTAQAYGVTRVNVSLKDKSGKTREIELEIATYRRDIEAHMGRKQTKVAFSSLEDDIKRRDFTVNSLALNPDTNQLVDLVDGLSDIEHKIIRFIGDPTVRIQEDPLRILRAIRLKNQLGFDYNEHTYRAITDAITKGGLEDIAKDRIKFELTKMIAHKHRRFALNDLDKTGGLEVLLPEITLQKNTPQPKSLHAEGSVWRHSLLTMQYLPDIISPRLAWAALLHDAGKPGTIQSVQETGDRIRFHDHHAQGSMTADKILKRLRFGKRFRSDVVWLVHYHLAIDEIPNMRPGRAKQFMSHPAFADLLQLHKADAHAAWSMDEAGNIHDGPADFTAIEKMWQQFQDSQHQYPPSLKRDLGIDGSWLMSRFKIGPGPALGEILKQLEEDYLDGNIASEKDAEEQARKLIEKQY